MAPHAALSHNRLRIASAVTAAFATGLAVAGATVASTTSSPTVLVKAAAVVTQTLNVDPVRGSDAAAGTSAAPLKTIQIALNRALPGTTIVLAPGAYHERPVTTVDGTAAAPITIRGAETGLDPAGRYGTVLYGTSRIFNINNSHYVLEGFTIDGQEALHSATWPTTTAAADAFKDSVQSKVADGRLIYIGSADTAHDLTDVTINNMYLHGAGGECVRIRNRSTDIQVENSSISWCGLFGKPSGASKATYHNGEGVYIGTSPNSTDQPYYANDTTSGVWVHDDQITTFGSECVDVKEHANANLVENVQCGDNTEALSFNGSNLELRGYGNTVRNSTLFNSLGNGLKIAINSGVTDPGGNIVQNVSFSGQTGSPIANSSTVKQGLFCGVTADKSPLVSGTSLGDVAASCGTPSPTPTPTVTPTPTPTPTVTPTPTPTVTPTPTPTPTPTVTPIGGLSWEAESGQLTAPFTTAGDTAALGGRYVVQTSKSGVGSETYLVNVPAKGKWVLAGRVIAPNGSSNSFNVRWDGTSAYSWALPDNLKTWTWVTGSKQASLAAGLHTLVISMREAGTMLDALQLTQVG